VRGVLLDVNETVLDLSGLQPAFDRIGLPDAMPVWFALTLRNGFALAASGDCRPFADVARDALVSLDPGRLSARDGDVLLEAFAQLSPHPDVEPGLRRLVDAGIPVMTLTVGNADVLASIFDRHGMADLVVGHLSAADIGRWKPAPAPYLAGCLALGLQPRDVTMVAAHAWDLHGAHRAGLRTAWVSRQETHPPTVFDAPDITGVDLRDVAGQIAESAPR
jgi:2-haloacid dehalogenase